MAANNEIYNNLGNGWWDETVGAFASIRYWINPVRFDYFSRVLRRENEIGRELSTILDIGCGGGLLSEEFARAGYGVTGIDPAARSIENAREHAARGRLHIDYHTASGEHLPFSEGTFDVVLCCDVLEHVEDVVQVISEISRVLKSGGLFFYDTVNRTFASRIAVIKIMQEWPSTAFVPPQTHDWNRFIKPEDLFGLMLNKGLVSQDVRGIAPSCNPIAAWLNFRRCARGTISYQELGRRLDFHETGNTRISYMGYPLKRS